MVRDIFIPEYVKNLPDHLIEGWFRVYKEVYEGYGEKLAKLSSDKWVLEQLELMEESGTNEDKPSIAFKPEALDKKEQVDVEETVEDNKEVEEIVEGPERKPLVLTFEVEADKVFVKRDADGNDYVDFVLQDSTTLDEDGKAWSEDLLKQFAGDISEGKIPILGDFDHEEYTKITSQHADEGVIKKLLAKKNSIAKAVKGIFEKGKLWVRAIIDKRYKRVVENAKGVSLEAHVNPGDYKTEGSLHGFSFIFNKPLAKKTAQVVVA